MRSSIIAVLITASSIAAAQQKKPAVSRSGSNPAQQAEPITLGLSDLVPDTSKVLALAAELTSSTEATRATTTYARQYERLKNESLKLGQRLSEADREHISKVPTPDKSAIESLARERLTADQERARSQAEFQERHEVDRRAATRAAEDRARASELQRERVVQDYKQRRRDEQKWTYGEQTMEERMRDERIRLSILKGR